MCNLERLRSGPADIRRFFDIEREFDFTGNLQAGDIYPRRSGPAVRRREDGARELVMMEWGHPHYKREKTAEGYTLALKKNGDPYAPTPTTNIRHPHYPMFRDYLAPEFRCLVPSTSFAEPNPRAKTAGAPKNIWFGLKKPKDGLYAFAGIWRPWEGDWIKSREATDTNVYAFLTTDPNELIKPVHPKAMPVILDPDDYETWLTADWKHAKALQKPFPAEKMEIYPESP